MSKYKRGYERIGEKFGKITIVDYISVFNDNTGSKSYFLLQCDCGTFIKRSVGHYERISKIKSCGCVPSIPENEAFERIFKRWNWNRTKKHNDEANWKSKIKESSLTLDQFIELSKGNCFYCGSAPSRDTRISGYFVNGIDRIVNEIGYHFDNCVSSCTSCNLSKHIKTQEQFYAMCRAVAELHPATNDTDVSLLPIMETPAKKNHHKAISSNNQSSIEYQLKKKRGDNEFLQEISRLIKLESQEKADLAAHERLQKQKQIIDDNIKIKAEETLRRVKLRSIIATNLETGVETEYASQRHASVALGLASGDVCRVLNGKPDKQGYMRHSTKGYIFRHKCAQS